MRAIITTAVLALLAGPAAADDGPACPPAFQGAHVTVTKVADGVAVEFKNGSEHLEDMRDQLRAVADMLEQRGTQMQTASLTEAVEFPPVDLEVQDVALGARVTVKASRLTDIPALRELAFGFEKYWKRSACSAPLVSTSALRVRRLVQR